MEELKTNEKIRAAALRKWAEMTPEQREEIKRLQSEGMKSYWERMTREERRLLGRKISMGKRAAKAERKQP